ncbi:DinB family protein [Paenibacillus endoradicis]|uniref:DinB family protein n=1 Tax=Paenibacillus endoradicis TaxID=2972487 RepID=UPI002159B1DA|nr:DinB family protein [Paenibacillus endoradicis]MCR8656898.1 DinB family protein [Paenibacillus endoradicis]
MYRKIDDFILDWSVSMEGTLLVLQVVTDDKLDQSIVEGHSTLGWLGCHLADTVVYISGLMGFEVPNRMKDIPKNSREIVSYYELVSSNFSKEVSKLSDQDLVLETGIKGYSNRGKLLRFLIDHQTHHRGQMLVLLRQAHLTVPPVMGPTKGN